MLVKLSEPVRLAVLLFKIVGFGVLFQHKPLSIIAEPPSDLTTPPHSAEVVVILLTFFVSKIGILLVGKGLLLLSFSQLTVNVNDKPIIRKEWIKVHVRFFIIYTVFKVHFNYCLFYY
jgi:hypothetical protein